MACFGAPGPHVFADRLLLEIAALERETQGLLESALESRPLRCALCSVSPLWCAISSEDRGPGAHISGPLLQPHDAPGAGRPWRWRAARRAFYSEKAPATGRDCIYHLERKSLLILCFFSLLLHTTKTHGLALPHPAYFLQSTHSPFNTSACCNRGPRVGRLLAHAAGIGDARFRLTEIERLNTVKEE